LNEIYSQNETSNPALVAFGAEKDNNYYKLSLQVQRNIRFLNLAWQQNC
jgi:hypothetical protein